MPEIMPDLLTPEGWLPLVFMAIMGLSILAYVLLDGFDLGVGMLVAFATKEERDRMIASIGPFWDANETWLVLGVGILLVAFPIAHGMVLGELYLPVAAMLLGLILRGVAFDFRVKAGHKYRRLWDRCFVAGSLLAALAQGYMLGRLVTGFSEDVWQFAFACLIAVALASGYVLLGAGWLIIKTTEQLQLKAIAWGRRAMALLALGIAAVSIATPLVSQQVYEKWFRLEQLLALWPVPAMTALMFFLLFRSLRRLPLRLQSDNHYGDWVPFGCTVVIFMLAFHGLAYSLYPWLVLDKLTIWQAAAAPESLMVILVGTAVVLPVIVGYSIFAYRVFRGKATRLEYV
ncbi:MAG TPA: cytochrome d ubiquinol oxidase subunit II [Xanthomonadales bacterium]|nr:cytochrome d ubiquinol oxidase subunit II [Xanthomonadales bacterium]